MAHKNTPPSTQQITEIQKYYDETGMSLKQVGKKFNWNRHTLAKYIKIRNETLSDAEIRQNRVKAVVDWRRRVKEKLVEYKGGQCKYCGYKKCIDCLDFHHLDPRQKEFAISGKSYSFERLKSEVDKCELVCKNCHGEIHAK